MQQGPCSIYLITNKIDGKIYVGQTWDTLGKRWRGHKADAKIKNLHISNAIKCYGSDNFIIEKIDEAHTQELADYLEDFYILAGDTIKIGYNLKRGGSTGKLTEQTKLKLSKAQTAYQDKQRAKKKNKPGKLDENQVKEIKILLVEGKLKRNAIASLYSVAPQTIAGIARGDKWKHVVIDGDIKMRPMIYNRITETEVRAIKHDLSNGLTAKSIATKYKVSEATVSDILTGKTWKGAANDIVLSNDKPNGFVGKIHPNSSLTEEKVISIRQSYEDGKSKKELAKAYAVSMATIRRIISRETWKHI